jgi:hypothetical protein
VNGGIEVEPEGKRPIRPGSSARARQATGPARLLMYSVVKDRAGEVSRKGDSEARCSEVSMGSRSACSGVTSAFEFGFVLVVRGLGAPRVLARFCLGGVGGSLVVGARRW